jgi:hypothetical protein
MLPGARYAGYAEPERLHADDRRKLVKYKVIRRGLVEQSKVVTADNERQAVDKQVGNDKGWKDDGDAVGWSYQTIPVDAD